MKRAKQMIKCILFISIGCVILFLTQKIMILNSNLLTKYAQEEFLNSDEQFDVVFLGSSHMAYGVSPMQIYEEKGISSYNLATEAQTLALSYTVLLRAFETQKPKVVVLDAASLFGGEAGREVVWRPVLDNTPFSLKKIEFAVEYENNTETKGGVLDAIIPMVRYHTRWKSLGKEDFEYSFKQGKSYTKGYMIRSFVFDSGVNIDTMNQINEYIKNDRQERYVNYQNEETIVENPLFINIISDHNIEYLEKIRNLCEQNNAELLVTKIPVVNMPMTYMSSWTMERYLMTQQICEQHNIKYFDLLYESDINLDLRQDSIDGGNHLNIKGASKVSDVLGRYLAENMQIEASENKQFEADMPVYKKIQQIALLESETDFGEWLELFDVYSDNWIMMIAVKKNCAGFVSEEVQQNLFNMNLKVNLNDIVNQSYIAIIDDKDVKEEMYSNRKIIYTYKDDGGRVYNISSAGYFTDLQCNFAVNDKQYAISEDGINIMVYDKKSANIIDKFSINTSMEKAQIQRNIDETAGLLCAYEQYYSDTY